MKKEPTHQDIKQAVEEWEEAHGPVPKLPYKASEWRPACGFHAYSAYEHPLELELGVDMSAM